MKLAPKLALFLLLVMVVVLAADAWVGIRRETDLLENDMQRDERDTGRVLGAAIAEVWRVDGRDRALQVVADANAGVAQVRVRWVDPHAGSGGEAPQLPKASERIQGGQVFAEIDRSAERFGRLFTYVPVYVAGQLQGALEISESLGPEQRYVRTLVLQRVVTAAALALLSGITAVLLGNWLVGRPIGALVDKARRIGAGDFTQPLQIHQRDEIGDLGRAIDTMCDQLSVATDRIAAETAARITALEQLRHADRLATVGQLAAGVAHELGTPLNVVSQRAKMIATKEVEGEEATEGARIVFEQSQRITAVIRQLLDFARRRTPQMAPQDLDAIIDQTATFLRPLARKRDAQIRIGASDGGHVARIDAGQLQQALTNLMMNGLQAMPKGGELSVAIGRKHAQPPADHGGTAAEYLALEVSDQGTGIAPENLPHLFEPFFTTKDVGEGTGLGLAVAYGIVREHGGWIGVESLPGRGSRFTIYLPAADGASGDLPEEKSA
jgi:signal transduction histidine kinase